MGSDPGAANPVTGSWGGQHAGLTLTESGGSIEYDCGNGSLAALRTDPSGNFTTPGFHIRGTGGPVRIDQKPDSVPASYVGRVRGDRMTLRVLVGADTLGPFELRRDEQPLLVRCL